MWFTEFQAGKIGRVSVSGAVSEYPPSGQTQLSAGANPSGIVAGPDGHLWFTEYGAGKIGELDPATGDLLSETATPSANPEGIAVGSDGQLWFVENSNGRIGSIDPSTHTVKEYFSLGRHLGPPCPGAVGIVPGPDGDLWATCSSDSTILRLDPTAAQPGTTDGLTSYNLPTSTAQPEGLTVGPDGKLWVAEYGADQLAEIDPSGVVAGTSKGITEYAAGGQPLLITSGGDGGLWSADHSGGQLLRFDPTTHATTTLGSAAGVSGQPNGVAPDSHGNIWFTSSGTATAVGEITFTNTTSTTTSTSTSTTTSRATTTTGPVVPPHVKLVRARLRSFSPPAAAGDGADLLGQPARGGRGASRGAGLRRLVPDQVRGWGQRTLEGQKGDERTGAGQLPADARAATGAAGNGGLLRGDGHLDRQRPVLHPGLEHRQCAAVHPGGQLGCARQR